MPKDTRDKVTLSPEAYKALEVESMLMGVSLKEAASRMILKSACPKCKEILGIMARPPKGQKEEGTKGTEAKEPNSPRAQEPKSPVKDIEVKDQLAQGSNSPMTQGTINLDRDDVTKGQRAQSPDVTMEQRPEGKAVPKAQKKSLAKDTEALAKIKDLWASGEHNAAEIGRRIGYDRRTVWDNINRMKKRGELHEDKPTGEEQPEELQEAIPQAPSE